MIKNLQILIKINIFYNDNINLSSFQFYSFFEIQQDQHENLNQVESQADQLKTEGNQYYQNKQYKNAYDKYTEAIQLYQKSVYYSNRANCAFFMENMLQAEEDSKKALELDPKNFKGYWRLAEVSRVKQQYKQAIQYYKQAQEISPKSYMIAKALIDMEKIEKTINLKFDLQKALSGAQIRSLKETGIQQQQSQQNSYYKQQVHTLPEVNRTFIIPQDIQKQSYEQKQELFNNLKDYIFNKNNLLNTSQMSHLLNQVDEVFSKHNIIETVQFPFNSKYYICGDLHGSRKDTKLLLDLINDDIIVNHDPLSHLIILGDMVDRGMFSTQILILMYILQIMYPENVHIIRGNHENWSLNQMFGFQQEFYDNYNQNQSLFMDVQKVFKNTPITLLIDELDQENQVKETTMCVHGGCPIVNSLKDIQDFKNLKISKEYEYENDIAKQILWNDPSIDEPDIRLSYRGVGYIYGKQAFQQFIQKMNIKRVFRGHEVVYDDIGVRDDFKDNTHITVFSSSYYQGNINKGGIVVRTVGEESYCVKTLVQ